MKKFAATICLVAFLGICRPSQAGCWVYFKHAWAKAMALMEPLPPGAPSMDLLRRLLSPEQFFDVALATTASLSDLYNSLRFRAHEMSLRRIAYHWAWAASTNHNLFELDSMIREESDPVRWSELLSVYADWLETIAFDANQYASFAKSKEFALITAASPDMRNENIRTFQEGVDVSTEDPLSVGALHVVLYRAQMLRIENSIAELKRIRERR